MNTVPTGVCGPGEVGPVCYSDPSSAAALDLFSAVAPADPVVSSQGLLPLFGNRLTCDARRDLPPMNVDLPLTGTQFPAEMVPYLEPALRLQAEHHVPVSFRIVQVRLSTGETVPQIVFFRTGDTPSIGEGIGRGGGSGTGTGGATPRVPTTTGLTVSLFGGSLAIVAYDRLLLQTLVDHHLMPAEARTPVMFGSVMTAHFILNQMGLVQSTPVQGLRTMPTFMGFQILSSLLLERLGMRADSPVTQFASLTLSAMPFLLARQSPALAQALANAGEIPTLAALGEMGVGAGTLRLGAVFARALGYIALVDIGSRIGVWGIGHAVSAFSDGSYENNHRLWNLIRTSQDIYNQERFGSVLAGGFGMIWTFFDSVDSMVSSSSEAFHTRNIERIQDTLIGASDNLGNALNDAIIGIIARNTTYAADGSTTTNWDNVATQVREIYNNEQNAENIRRGYELVDDATAPRTSSGIESLITIVSDRGEIRNQTEFRDYFHRLVRSRRIDADRRRERRMLELGLIEDVNGVRVSRIPVDPAQMAAFRAGLTQAQSDFLFGEGAQLTMVVISMRPLETALEQH